MTNEEAIKKLTRLKNEFLEEYLDFDGTVSAYDLAIEALEKQIPKKVIKYNYTTDVCCPYCGEVVLYSYCRNCGQRLNWKKEE